MRTMVLLAVLATASLAGCADGGPGGGAEQGPAAGRPTGGHGSHEPGTHLLAPNWTVGDSWTLQAGDATVTFAVAEDAGTDWILDTSDAELAFYDARYDTSFLGAVRKSDLAGQQGTDRIEYLRFPLSTGLEWSTPWDGMPVTVRAESVDGGVARLVATRDDGSTFAKYAYSARDRYFSEFDFYDDAGEAVMYALRLHHSAPGYTGDLVRYQLQPFFAHHGAFPGSMLQGFAIGPGLTDVHVSLLVACTAGGFSVQVGELSGLHEERGLSATGPCPASVLEEVAFAPPMEPEQWGVVASPVPAATQATLDLEVTGRVLVAFKAGAAPA